MGQVLPVPGPFLDVSVIYRGQVDGTVDLNNAIKVPDSANSVPDKAEKVPDTMKKCRIVLMKCRIKQEK